MSLNELMNERNCILKQLKSYEELELELKKIKKINNVSSSDEKLKVYKQNDYPELEDITESTVAEMIEQLTDNLSKIYEQINNY
jgi:DNA-binding transcriptional MerR regulator